MKHPDEFDPLAFGGRLTDAEIGNAVRTPERVRLPRPGPTEEYIGGPIPLGWACRAARLPGKALHLGMALWFAAVRSKGKRPTVVLSDQLANRFGLSARTTRARALAALVGAGLVSVENHNGRAPRVTILATDVPSGSE